MFLRPNILEGETHTSAVRDSIESTWRGNPILLFDAIRDAVERADFANALVLARELDAQKGLPHPEPTLRIPNGKGALDGPKRCPACDKRLHPREAGRGVDEEVRSVGD